MRRELPPYPITSVNHALMLIQLLRDAGGPVRLADVAEELGVARSTAHRLLGMLMFRDFAIQDEDRLYHPGPAIGQPPIVQAWVRELRTLAKPHMETLTQKIGESTNLMVRVGARVRFLSSVQSAGEGAVGDRQGMILPAIYTAGGRAILADLPGRALEVLLGSDQASRSGDALPLRERLRLQQELQHVREVGYARNLNDTEPGVSAFSIPVRGDGGRPLAAVAVAMRSSRVAKTDIAAVITELRACVRAIELGLARAGIP